MNKYLYQLLTLIASCCLTSSLYAAQKEASGGEIPIPFSNKTVSNQLSSKVLLYGFVKKADPKLGFGPRATYTIDAAMPVGKPSREVPIAGADKASDERLKRIAGSKTAALVAGTPFTLEGKTILKVTVLRKGQLADGNIVFEGLVVAAGANFCWAYQAEMDWKDETGKSHRVGVKGRDDTENKKLKDAIGKQSIVFLGFRKQCIEGGSYVQGKVYPILEYR